MTAEERHFLGGLKKTIGGGWAAEYRPKTCSEADIPHTLDTVGEALGISRWRVRDLLTSLTRKGYVRDWNSFGLPLWRLIREDESEVD